MSLSVNADSASAGPSAGPTWPKPTSRPGVPPVLKYAGLVLAALVLAQYLAGFLSCGCFERTRERRLR